MLDAFETGEEACIAKALGVVARVDLTLKTTLAVMRALGVEMTAPTTSSI